MVAMKKFFILFLIIGSSFNIQSQEIPLFENNSSSTTDEFDSDFDDEEESDEEISTFSLKGFLDARFGSRMQSTGDNLSYTLSEARAQVNMKKDFENVSLKVVTDIKYDTVEKEDDINLDRGLGPVDLRNLSLSFSPMDSLDIITGRQVLTWGTGDLLFINDLFSKDWNSFFIGRDLEYLKAPSDAIKISNFNDYFNMDFVWTPVFDSDRYISGERLNYFSGATGREVGLSGKFRANERTSVGDESEFSTRISKVVEGNEIALYGYKGFWKSPEGMNSKGEFYFPELQVLGASLRTPLFGGVGNIEYGHYESKEDHLGNNSRVRNSEDRFLLGYEHELAKDFTGSLQYYVEAMNDYEAYEKTLPSGALKREEYRQMATVRLTKLLMNQDLTLSFFAFYSPSDQDGHLRPSMTYKITDDLRVDAGVNYFFGTSHRSFWGQFENNSNIYSGIRFSF